MGIPEITHITTSQEDIFDFVIGRTQYDPIEKRIDASKYSTYRTFIYDSNLDQVLKQDEVYKEFWCQLRLLKQRSEKMSSQEILRICEELQEISPKELYL